MEINRLLIVIKRPVTRQEKRIYEKEVGHIKNELLPMFYAFGQVYKGIQTEYDLCQAESVFIKRTYEINKNKKFVQANKNSFRLTFSTKEESTFEKLKDRRTRFIGLAVIILILLLVLLSIFS